MLGERQSRTGDQVFHRAGDKDLVGAGETCDARSDMHGDAGDTALDDLDLTGMKTGPDLDPELVHAPHDRAGAADSSRRSIECRKEAVARRADLLTTESSELFPHETVVVAHEGAPPSVAKLYGTAGRLDHVSE